MHHPSAIIDPSAKIDESVEIGPFSIIGADVTIGKDTKIESHVILKGPTIIGERNHIFQFSTVGDGSPDKKYKDEPTLLKVGDDNIIREGVTIHRGTVQDTGETIIGNRNLIMAYSHIAHDWILEDGTIAWFDPHVAPYSDIIFVNYPLNIHNTKNLYMDTESESDTDPHSHSPMSTPLLSPTEEDNQSNNNLPEEQNFLIDPEDFFNI